MNDAEIETTVQIIIILINVVCISLGAFVLIFSIYQLVHYYKSKSAYKAIKKKYTEQYGTPDYEAKDFKTYHRQYSYMFAHHASRILVINGVEFKYSDILNFRCTDEVSYQHHSSPISGFIRGEIGRATIGGDKGFFMGAMTAPQYTSEHHKYIIRIITTHPQHKTIHYVTSSEDNGEMAIIILEYILSTNEDDRIYGKPVP